MDIFFFKRDIFPKGIDQDPQFEEKCPKYEVLPIALISKIHQDMLKIGARANFEPSIEWEGDPKFKEAFELFKQHQLVNPSMIWHDPNAEHTWIEFSFHETEKSHDMCDTIVMKEHWANNESIAYFTTLLKEKYGVNVAWYGDCIWADIDSFIALAKIGSFNNMISQMKSVDLGSSWHDLEPRVRYYISLPKEAEIIEVKTGTVGFAESYYVEFDLPETKHPVEWMLDIAKESNETSPLLSYITDTGRELAEDSSGISRFIKDISKVKQIETPEWECCINLGILKYNVTTTPVNKYIFFWPECDLFFQRT